MKKLILSAAIILGSFSAFAQTSNTQTTTSQTTTVEPTTTQTAQETVQTSEVKYTEIKTEEVPDVVTAALKKAYPTAIVDKVYINDKKEYKLEIKVGDKVGALYADATGNWIKK